MPMASRPFFPASESSWLGSGCDMVSERLVRRQPFAVPAEQLLSYGCHTSPHRGIPLTSCRDPWLPYATSRRTPSHCSRADGPMTEGRDSPPLEWLEIGNKLGTQAGDSQSKHRRPGTASCPHRRGGCITRDTSSELCFLGCSVGRAVRVLRPQGKVT